MVKGLLKCFGLHDLRMLFRTVGDGIDILRDAIGIRPDKKLEAKLLCHSIAELNHFVEFPARIDVHEREGNLAWIERFLRKTKHYGRIFPDGIEHDGILEFRSDFANDVNAFSFKLLQMCECIVFHGLIIPNRGRRRQNRG